LTGVQAGDAAAVDQATRTSFKRRMASLAGDNAQRYLLEALKADAKIVLHNEDI